MLKYEIKKIYSKPINKIALAALLALTMTAGFLTIRDVTYITENEERLSGIPAAQRLRELKNGWKGELTEDVLKQVVEMNLAIQSPVGKAEDYESADAYENAVDDAYVKKQGFADIRELISSAFSGLFDYDYFRADSVTADEIDGFYQERIDSLKKWLSSGEEHFSDAEKEFLIGQYEALSTPLHYEYADGWMALMGSQYLPTLMIILTVILGLLVSGIFSDEFQMKADSIFFSARLGRGRAILSKIKAGFVTVTAVYWGVILLYTLFVLCALGFGGAGVAVQIGSKWRSIYNLTYFQDYLFTVIGGYVGNLFILTFSMLVSAKSRSTVLATTVPFVLSCAPMFLGRISVFSRIMTFFPDQLLRINTNLDDFVLYTIGGKVVGYLTILIPMYIVLYALLIPALYKVYQRTEVK